MAGKLKLERIGVVLALAMAAAALGLEIRRAGGPPQQATSQPGYGVAPFPVAPPDGKLTPFPVPKDGHEILPKNGELPRMQGFVDGRKRYELSAKRLVMTRGAETTVAEGIQGATLLGKNGQPTIRFTCERAIMDTVTKDLQVQGQVHVESTDPKNPVVFETRDMQWNAREEKLICPNPVDVTQPGVRLRGSRMTADVRLKKLSVEGGIVLDADAARVRKSLGLSGSAAPGKPSARPGRPKGSR